MHLKYNYYSTDLNIYSSQGLQESVIESISQEVDFFCLNFQSKYSRFDPYSIISILNKDKIAQADEQLIDMIELSIYYYKYTNGYFNPLINLDYFKSDDAYFADCEYNRRNMNLDLESIQIKGNQIFLMPNMNLDLGGIGKSISIKSISNILDCHGLGEYIVDFGGDIYSKNYQDGTSIIGLSLLNEDQVIGQISLSNNSICCSSINKRNWKIGNNSYHHIFNPIIREFPKDINTVYVIDKDIVFSDVIATSLLSMGKNTALNFVKSQRINAIILDVNSNLYLSENVLKLYDFKLFIDNFKVYAI